MASLTFLKKFGQIALAGAKVVSGYAPLVQPLLPAGTAMTVSDTVTGIAAVIMQAEVMGQALSLEGAEKLRGAAPAVAQILLTSPFLLGKKINDPEKFQRGAVKIADGMADVLNSLKADDLETRDVTA